MVLSPDTRNCGLRLRRECREGFPRHRLQRKQLVSDPGMHHGTCVTHVPWCMSGSLTRRGRKNVPGIPSACATRNFTYLEGGPLGIPLPYHYSECFLTSKTWKTVLKTESCWQVNIYLNSNGRSVICWLALHNFNFEGLVHPDFIVSLINARKPRPGGQQ